jgi:hypothetical protein
MKAKRIKCADTIKVLNYMEARRQSFNIDTFAVSVISR